MNHQIQKYPFILLAGLPLLALAGCASNESTPTNDDVNTTQIETSHVEQTSATMFAVPKQQVEPTAEILPEAGSQTASSSDTELYPSGIMIAEPVEHIIGFGFDKAEVDTQYLALLKQHAKYLSGNDQLMLQVNGHTDSMGPKAYNEWLSKQRAEAVANYLIEQGAPKEQITVSALADDEPLADATTQRDNRRVELNYQDQRMVSK